MAANQLNRLLDLRRGEWPAFCTAFCYFFFLLAA